MTASASPTVKTALHAIEAALRAQADPERAVGMQAYMKNQFVFLGIPATARRQALQGLLLADFETAQWLELADCLWEKPEREFRYTAVDLLGKHHRQLDLDTLPHLLNLVQRDAWWDTVDALAGVIGDVLLQARRQDPGVQRLMDAALEHANLWVRRVAMLHQLGWKTHTDEARLYRYALALAAEPGFFIRKAIGWALRDYARVQPDGVREFLQCNKDVLSPLTRREAGKHL